MPVSQAPGFHAPAFQTPVWDTPASHPPVSLTPASRPQPRTAPNAGGAFIRFEGIVTKVLLPEATPSIVLTMTPAIVSLIGYSAMVRAVGRGGLGDLGIRYGYQRFMPDVVRMLEALLEEAQGDEDRPAMGDVVGDLIEDYETEHHRLPEATGVDALRFLITQHGVNQGDLPEIGSQGVVSEILGGKRELNLRQVRALAKRFGVTTATFV